MIPLTVPALSDEEVAASARVLRSGMLVQGKEVRTFEELLAASTGRAHALAVTNGTAALELALRALGVGPGDEVLCPALTWPSPAHATQLLGAIPVLVDVDLDEWNATEDQFARAITERTKAAIVIEQFGNPARHAAIADALRAIPVIVDAACSLGSSYQGAPCGSHGLISCTSFHPRKVITTGEGGAIFTDDPALASELAMLRNHGQREPGVFGAASGNHRLTEVAGAIGQEQMKKLEGICTARRRLALRYEQGLPEVSYQRAPTLGVANRQTLGVLVGPPGQGSRTRDRLIEGLLARSVQAGKLSYALHTLPQFADEARAARARGERLDNAQDIAERGLCLPLFPSMRDEQVDQVITAVHEVLAVLSRES